MTNQSENEFIITRSVDAPRELVWKAHTEYEQLQQWWGPEGFIWERGTLDLQPGGIFHYGMKSPNGQFMWGRFVYREVVPLSKLVYVVSFSDEKGGVTRHPFAPNWPLEVLSTLTFEEQGGKTILTMRGIPVNATELERKTFKEGHQSMRQGFKGTLDQFDVYLEKCLHDE